MKVDLGCGSKKKDGFIGVDIDVLSDADIIADLNEPLSFKDGEVSHINSSHVFEHLTNPLLALSEINRILEPGGTAYIRVPHPSDHNCMWGHPDHKRCLPVDWWSGECNRLGLREHKRISFSLEGEQPLWRTIITKIVDTIANDICGIRLWERLNPVTMKEIRVWIKKK